MTTQTIEDGFEKVWKMFQELHRQFQVTQAFLKEKSEETDKRLEKNSKPRTANSTGFPICLKASGAS